MKTIAIIRALSSQFSKLGCSVMNHNYTWKGKACKKERYLLTFAKVL